MLLHNPRREGLGWVALSTLTFCTRAVPITFRISEPPHSARVSLLSRIPTSHFPLPTSTSHFAPNMLLPLLTLLLAQPTFNPPPPPSPPPSPSSSNPPTPTPPTATAPTIHRIETFVKAHPPTAQCPQAPSSSNPRPQPPKTPKAGTTQLPPTRRPLRRHRLRHRHRAHQDRLPAPGAATPRPQPSNS